MKKYPAQYLIVLYKLKSLHNDEVTWLQNGAQNAHDIDEKIVAQGDRVRRLKADKVDKVLIDAEIKILLALKAEYKANAGEDWKSGIVLRRGVSGCAAQLQTENDSAKEESSSDEITRQRDKIAELQKLLDQELEKLHNLRIKEKSKTREELKFKCYQTQKQSDEARELTSNKEDKNDAEMKCLFSASKSKADRKEKNRELRETAVANFITDRKDSSEEITKSAEKTAFAIKNQGDKVRSLKSSKADKNIIDQEVKILLSLKNDYKNAFGQDWKPEASEATASKRRKEERTVKSEKTLEREIAKGATAKDVETSKTGTRLGLEAKKEDNFFDWYSQIITKSGMIEYYDVSGCYILRPWSFAIWKMIKDYIDKEITALGVQECYFPIFVTRAVLEKEKTHIADFAPEVAWVTKCGESDLAEPIAIRPTSETVMYPAYAKWLRSDTELPLKLNQWNNVVVIILSSFCFAML